MEMSATSPVIMNRWAALRAMVMGDVITPDDLDYDRARQAWNLFVDQRPAVIVKALHADDVVAAVNFARQERLGVAVQATGHGNVRPADDALLILTAAMQDVHINAVAQTAWIGAGVQWGTVLAQAQAVGLTPLLGSAVDVGAVGYTLGGGFGWLGRKYGLSLDNVNFFEVVTADGRRLVAAQSENPDLFWGLRGGGGSLGIITGMEVRLFPVTTVYAGNLFYPIEQAQSVFARYREWIRTAPDELTSSIVVMNYPPFEEIPAHLRGQTFAHVRGCFCGPVSEGERLLAFWREWRTPLIDDFKPMPFTDAATISDDPPHPLPGLSTAAWLRELNDDVIDTLIAYGAATEGSPLIFAEIRHAGGAVSRPDPALSAYGNRDATQILQMVGVTPTVAEHQAIDAYCDRMKQALRPYLTGGVYLNFLEGAEAQSRIQDGYTPAAYRRLRELKARYDPDNRLAYSFNILPA